jgi:glucuronate isomerase
MLHDELAWNLYKEICRIPLIDAHSHINPHQAAAKGLDDILGYHYYTELAHSAGMDKAPLAKDVDPRERVRAILGHMDRFDNTAQYGWFLEIARTFLGFQGDRFTALDADGLFDAAAKQMGQADWEQQVWKRSNLDKVFLTNDFDDPLQGIDLRRYIPCLRTDDLVFRLHQPEVRQRLAKVTGVEVGDVATMRRAVGALFQHFTRHGARACAISLPPQFEPDPGFIPFHDDKDPEVAAAFARLDQAADEDDLAEARELKVFWMLAEHCKAFKLPFDLMVGVNRKVYAHGVPQGQDLFDQRTSLAQLAPLFNSFPDVTFCVSVLSSGQNQELASYSWIFPNVITSGHWWYSNIPAYIEQDARARLQAVPKTKQIGYYSDAYKLEFVLPKFNMYRRLLAKVLADDFVRTKVYTEAQALELARLLLRDNARWIFSV